MDFLCLKKISWCTRCNVPIVGKFSKCPLCGSELIPLFVGNGEIRPVFELEKNWYRQLIITLGKDPEIYLPEKLIFYYQGSILVDGHKVFRVIYDEKERKWRVKFFKKFKNNFSELSGSNKELVIEANLKTLEAAESESLNFIKDTFRKYEKFPKAVSFSGGKDSVVVLYQATQIKPDIDVLYMNTTIDYPETESYIKKIQNDWNLNLIEVKPIRDFFDFYKDLGPPSQFMKWCCKTLKFGPLSRLIEDRYETDVLVATGIRKNESYSRRNFQRVQRNDKVPKQVLMFPILNWNSLLVWLYIYWKKIPINEAYLQGRSRIGCWPCPERRPKEFKILERTHPKLWDKYKSALFNYAKLNGIFDIDNWINSGNWRLRTTSYNKKYIKASSLCSQYEQILYKISDVKKIDEIIEFLKVFGDIKNIGTLKKIHNNFIDISIIKNNIRVGFIHSSNIYKKLFEFQLERALNCIGCGACVSHCKIGALKILEGKLRITSDCIHCLECLKTTGLRKGCVSLNYKKNQILVK